MKKLLAVLLSLMLAATLCFSATAEELEGGWAVTADTAVTEEAQAAFDAAMEGFVGSNVEPIALLGTQLVSGTNYCFLCRVTPVVPDATGHYALVYVYQPLSDKAELLSINDLQMNAYEDTEEGDAMVFEPLTDEQVDDLTGEEEGRSFATWTDAEGNVYDLFTVTAFEMDADNRVIGITGSYSTIGVSEDGYYDSVGGDLNGPFTYPLAADFHADMSDSESEDGETDYSNVTDLYSWYVDAYMGGEADPNGALDFWFVTTQIELNEDGEVTYMTYVYVPWA